MSTGPLNANEKVQIKEQREILTNAKTAFKNATIRKIAEKYPDWKEAKRLTYENALKLERFNQGVGRVVPIKEIKSEHARYSKEKDHVINKINNIQSHKTRLNNAKIYLNNFEKWDEKVQKFENNPLLKGKLLFSKSANLEYQEALNERENSKRLMNNYGINDRQDFNQQLEKLEKAEQTIPGLQQNLTSLNSGLDMLNTVVKAVEQANRSHQWSKDA